MIGDRELLAFRLEYCALLSRLFVEETDEELMRLLTEGARDRARASAEMDPAAAEGWFELDELAAGKSAAECAARCTEEFVVLFVGPGIPKFTPCESFYRSGQMYGVQLGHVRQFMERVNLIPAEETHEPEDHISFELNIFRFLIEKQMNGQGEEEEARWLAHQGEFLRRHLLTWAPDFFGVLIDDEEVHFFRAFAKIASGYLAWENTLLKDWGSEIKTEDLLEVRPAKFWKGPTFEVPVPNPELIEESPSEPE